MDKWRGEGGGSLGQSAERGQRPPRTHNRPIRGERTEPGSAKKGLARAGPRGCGRTAARPAAPAPREGLQGWAALHMPAHPRRDILGGRGPGPLSRPALWPPDMDASGACSCLETAARTPASHTGPDGEGGNQGGDGVPGGTRAEQAAGFPRYLWGDAGCEREARVPDPATRSAWSAGGLKTWRGGTIHRAACKSGPRSLWGARARTQSHIPVALPGSAEWLRTTSVTGDVPENQKLADLPENFTKGRIFTSS